MPDTLSFYLGQVNVQVNGHPIPFNMKIGEAGEAFFVNATWSGRAQSAGHRAQESHICQHAADVGHPAPGVSLSPRFSLYPAIDRGGNVSEVIRKVLAALVARRRFLREASVDDIRERSRDLRRYGVQRGRALVDMSDQHRGRAVISRPDAGDGN